MRIAIVSMDTRGGVQPYVALGLGLSRAGHEVRMIAPSDFEPMFREAGLLHAPLTGSVEAVLRGSGGTATRGALRSMRFAACELPGRIHAWTKETLEACEGVDVVTGGVGGMVVGLSVAEKLEKPFVEAHLQPLGAPTDAYPGVMFAATPRWLGGWGRRVSHRLSEAAVWMPFERAMASAREKVLGLTGAPRTRGLWPALYGFSRHVVPLPHDPKRERHVTGYWFLPAASTWTPPLALEQFLARPGPVVSIGFGSMASEDAASSTALVTRAARRAGVRAVLLSGWGGLEARYGADDVMCAEAIPHDWLFPRVSAVVHHGGAGTTGAGLRAGVPSIVVPFTMDQPFWGSRVAALGVGPTPIPHAGLTEASLAEAIERCVADHGMRARAAELGAQIRAEDGVLEATELLGRIGYRRAA